MISVDIAAGHVACGIFERASNGGLVLRKFGVERFEAEVVSENAWVDRAGVALGLLAARMDLRGSAVLSIPDRFALTKFLKVVWVAKKKRRDVIAFEAAQVIPFPLADVAWDFEIIADSDKELDVAVTVAKRASVDSLCAAAPCLSVCRIVPASHAFRQAIGAGTRSTSRSLVVDFQGETTTLVVTGPNLFRTRIVGRTDSGFEKLQHEIGRFLAHTSRETGIAGPETILLAGQVPDDARLREMLTGRFGAEVELLDPPYDSDLTVTDVVAESRTASAIIAPLVGLSRDRSDAFGLLPERRRGDLGFRRRQPVILGVVALLIAATFPPLIYFRSLDRTLRGHVLEVESRLVTAKTADREREIESKEFQELERRIATARRLLAAKSVWVEFFADLQQRLASVGDVWIEQFALKPALSVGKSDVPPRVLFAVSGRLLDVANPTAKVSVESCEKIRSLFASIAESPFVATIQDERFDNSQPGLLKFDVTLVASSTHPL